MIIRLNGVTKYYAKLKALDDLSLDVRPGAIGLLGPNGAGKSTLIKLLLGLVKLSRGEASVLDMNVRTEARRIRQSVGYMPEDECAVAGLKGVEMVAYSGELAGLPGRTALRRAHEMLDYVRLADERYREVQTYSTGMKQRVKLAQALIHSPRLVFLDEPTSGLDPKGREQMLRLIRDLSTKRGVSVVVSTHILHDVEACCDAVVILGGGRLLVQDDLQHLQRSVDDVCRIRLDGERAPFVAALEAEGLEVDASDPEEIRLVRVAEDLSDHVLRAARTSGTSVRYMAPSRNSLEEIFLEAVRSGHADS